MLVQTNCRPIPVCDFQTCGGVPVTAPKTWKPEISSAYFPNLQWGYPLTPPQTNLEANARQILVRDFQICGGVTPNPTTNLETSATKILVRDFQIRGGVTPNPTTNLETSATKILVRDFQIRGGVTPNPTTNLETSARTSLARG